MLLGGQDTYCAVCIHIAMVDGRAEVNLGRGEGIVIWDDNIQGEDTSLIRRAKGPFDEDTPEVEAFLVGS